MESIMNILKTMANEDLTKAVNKYWDDIEKETRKTAWRTKVDNSIPQQKFEAIKKYKEE